MSHYVILTSDYQPKPSANGVCAEAVAKALVERGCKVDIVCYGAEYKVTLSEKLYQVHTIRWVEDASTRLKWIKHKLFALCNLVFYPVRSNRNVKSFCKAFEIIHKDAPVDCVIAVQKPASTIEAARRIKNKHKDVGFILYELDSLSNDIEAETGWKRFFRWKSKLAETRNYAAADSILHLKTYERYYNSETYQSVADKSYFVELPLISKEKYDQIQSLQPKKPAEEISFIYTGVLMEEYRSPRPFAEIAKVLSKSEKITCRFYSRGNCETYLTEEETATDGVIQRCGYVVPDVLDQAIAEADALISIGNSLAEEYPALPSKTFSYMSTGKPIIHMVSGKNDVCCSYLARYPAALLIDPEEDAAVNAEKVASFLRQMRGKVVPYEDIEANFRENTPQYFVDLIFKISKECEQ